MVAHSEYTITTEVYVFNEWIAMVCALYLYQVFFFSLKEKQAQVMTKKKAAKKFIGESDAWAMSRIF